MTDHSNDSADENDGKYSTDQQMTFDSLLKNESSSEQSMKKCSDSVDKQQSSESISGKRPREPLTRRSEKNQLVISEGLWLHQLGKHTYRIVHLKLAGGETKAIGYHTTYELARTEINKEHTTT